MITEQEKDFYILQNKYVELSQATNSTARDFADVLFKILKDTGVIKENSYLNCYRFRDSRVSMHFHEYLDDSEGHDREIDFCFTYDLDTLYEKLQNGDYVKKMGYDCEAN